MSWQKCPDCSKKLRSKRQARKHYQKEHSGEIETPEEYLERVESEQRDFAGEEPSTEGHNPEYLAENEREDTRRTTLFQHTREADSAITEHLEDGSEDTEGERNE